MLGSTLDAVVAAGSCVMYDYRLLHRGMPNTSAGTLRPVLQYFYHLTSYSEQRNYGKEKLFTSS